MQISDYLTIEALDHIDGDVGIAGFGHMGAETTETAAFRNFTSDVVVMTPDRQFVPDAMVMLVNPATMEPYHQIKTDSDGRARFSVSIPMSAKLAVLVKKDRRFAAQSDPVEVNPEGGEAAVIQVAYTKEYLAELERIRQMKNMITYGSAALIGGVILYNLVKKI